MLNERRLAELVFRKMTGKAPVRHPGAESLTVFKRHVYKRYRHAGHLEALDQHLMAVTRYVETLGAEGIGRLIIAMPPRHGKTLTTSKLYPVWHLGRNPRNRVMLVSYGQSLAQKNSRAARNFIRSAKFQGVFPGVELAEDSQSVSEWNIAGSDGEGGADALGIGGGATGKGAHVLIIDDPIKNREQAESQTYRDKIWDGYTDDLLTRLEPGGAVVIMHTRWHEDDLVGRLLKSEGERWLVLNLPALAVEDDVLGREPGAALWPDRYPVEVLQSVKDTMGPYSWAALYQQNPRPAEGGILKKTWFKRVPAVLQSDVVRVVRYWDLAMSEKTSADYTAGLKLAEMRNGEHVILDVARGRVELADLPSFLEAVMLADGKEVRQGFEEKGYMTRAIRELVKRDTLHGYTIRGYDVEGDKLTRVLPAAARAALGMVHVLDAPFSDPLLDEFASFPNGAHDDQVDALSGAWRMLEEKTVSRKATAVKYA